MGFSNKEFFVKDLVIDDEYGIISSDATIHEAAKKMKEIGIPDLVVIDKNSEKVIGVVGDFDIVQNVVAEGKDPNSLKVVDAMYVITPVTLETSVEEAFERMRELQVNVVPVVEDGKILGVCTIQDCWSYIPDQIVDEVGLIPIKNTKVVEFWFASVASILAFVLGVILPMAGIFGFFQADESELLSLFNIADIRGGMVSFYLFEARGNNFLIALADIVANNGGIWILVIIFSFLILIFGILGMFSIIYNSFIDIRYVQTGKLIRYVIPTVFVFALIFEWIFYSIALAVSVPSINYTVDVIGLIMSILSMSLMLLAIFRDYLFRASEVPKQGLLEEV
ncbi:MAG: CBS domain-containing protein [Candidatus Lokiarchaeota archaeon]|nr:CBS domain-containing protein [Candidatus Lokiarchaeota archaeon]